MADRQQFERIEAYLTRQMPEAEAKAFEERMAQDEELALEVELQRLEHDSMEYLLEADLKQKMKKWEESPPVHPYAEPEARIVSIDPRMRWVRLLQMAALIVVSLAAFFLYREFVKQAPEDHFTQEQQPVPGQPSTPEKMPGEEIRPQPGSSPDRTQPDGLYTQEESKSPSGGKDAAPRVKQPDKKTPPYQTEPDNKYLALAVKSYEAPPPFSSGLKSADMPADESAFSKAAAAFDQGKYQEVLSLLGPSSPSEQSTSHYLRGHAYFLLKNFPAATREFKAVTQNEFAPDFQEAQWYLLLSYLAQMPERKAEFLELAEKMEKDEYGNYREKVKELLSY